MREIFGGHMTYTAVGNPGQEVSTQPQTPKEEPLTEQQQTKQQQSSADWLDEEQAQNEMYSG